MAFKTLLKSLDEVDEPLREHYAQQEDGTFSIAHEATHGDVRTFEDVGGLKSALAHEKNDGKAAKGTLAERDATIETLTTENATLKDANKDSTKKAEEMSASQISAMKKDIEDKETAWGVERTGYQKDLRSALIDNSARRAIEKHKGNSKILMREVIAAADIVKGADGSTNVIIKDEKGNPRYADPVKGTYMDIEGFVAEMKKDDDWALAFEGSGGSGSGSRGAERANGAAGTPKHRGDFADTKTKAAWVRENGQDAFEKLPMAPRA